MATEHYGMHSIFNIDKHKKNFINYFEAIIMPSGEVVYAVPSHIEKLISITGEPREQIYEKMPITASPIDWLLDYTGCISLWSDFYKGTAKTQAQAEMLHLLIGEGLTSEVEE